MVNFNLYDNRRKVVTNPVSRSNIRKERDQLLKEINELNKNENITKDQVELRKKRLKELNQLLGTP